MLALVVYLPGEVYILGGGGGGCICKDILGVDTAKLTMGGV